MADKNEEIQRFVRVHIKDFLQVYFSEKVYKQNKRVFFFEALQNKVGMPKDNEIANAALNYLLKLRFFKKLEDLQNALNLPFFSNNIREHSFFIQKYENDRNNTEGNGLEIDFKHLEEKIYYDKIYEKIKNDVIKQHSKEIEEKIKEKQDRYNSIPSILDTSDIYAEPSPRQEQVVPLTDSITGKYLPWWKKIGLKGDPFPTIDGLGNIDEDDYEEIIIKTSIYEKYVSIVQNTREELFKNTVFYGQFGSGKTTLFEYLQKPMIRNKIYAILIRLSAEPDYQNFLIRFKQKLFTELQKIYQNFSGGEEFLFYSSSNTSDEGLITILQQIYKSYSCSGIVIFIDDIYKIKDYENTALKFLNHLQTFKGELTRESGIANIGFFVSAPLEWKRILNDDLSYSGSVSREESMPMITINEALNMLNKRLEIFLINKENNKKFAIEFVQQIYRELESKKTLTFRQFIKEAIRRFENGNFDILISNPVAIGIDTLKRIQRIFEQDFQVSSGIENIFESNMTVKNKSLCFQILIQVFLKKGIKENSDFFKDNIFYFDKLKQSNLIVKIRVEKGETKWRLSPELIRLNNKIYSMYSYSLEDYFFKIYKNIALVEDSVRNIGKREEIIKCEKLIEGINTRKSKEFSLISSLMKDVLSLHKDITKQLDTPSLNINQKQLEKDYYRSIELATRAVALYSGYNEVVSLKEFWNNFWNYPDSVSEYIKRTLKEDRTLETRIWILGAAYESAFTEIVNYLYNEINKSEIFNIPIRGLKSEEISIFHDVRDEYSKREYFNAVSKISRLVELKIRELLYNLFILQYGQQFKRMQRIPVKQRQYIADNIKKDSKIDLGISKNEFTYLNRHDYGQIIIGETSPTNKNWSHTFSKIFFDWNKNQMLEYLDKFGKFNLTSAHYKDETLTHEQQTMIYKYIISSIDFLRRINQAYLLLLQSIQKLETAGGPTKYQYFFSLDQNKDIQELEEIRILKDDAAKIIELWKKSKENHFDLSNIQQLEQKYGIEYRQVFAILAALLKEQPKEIVKSIKIIKENSPLISITVI